MNKILIIVAIVFFSTLTNESYAIEDSSELQKKDCMTGTFYEDGVCKVIDPKPDGYDGCLIATSSYGSEIAPQVQMLREVRDNILLNTESGTMFIDGFNPVYYSFSPQVAQLENENPIFKEAVKLFITPMIITLSIMTLAHEDSEFDVIFLGISTIGLIVGMYIIVPVVIIYKIKKILILPSCLNHSDIDN